MRLLISQLARFGAVGAIGFVVDFALFNFLVVTVLSADRLHEGPLWAKVISTSVAIVVNWIGNRYWTFNRDRPANVVREAVEFASVSVVGLLIAIACLWISHYALGFTSIAADNIANFIGLGLGTVFRFVLYRYWVYNPKRARARVRVVVPTPPAGPASPAASFEEAH